MAENEYSESTADSVYKWTVRTLYTAAIGLNVYFLYQQYKDTESGKELKNRYDKLYNSVVKPIKDKKLFRRQADETLVEAWIIVDEAKKEQEEN
jgi:hypothetical protein